MSTSTRAAGGVAPASTASAETSTRRFGAGVAGMLLAAWLPVPVAVALGPRAGWALVLVLGVAAALATREAAPGVVLGALLGAAALTATGLVTPESEYMPVAVCGLALLGGWAWRLRSERTRPAVPPWPVAAAVSVYLVWATVSTLFSIDRRLSATYAVGMLVVMLVAFVLAPGELATAVERRRLLGVVIAMAVVAGASNVVLWFTGPVSIFGREIGDYLDTNLVLAHRLTPLVIPRVSGVFLAPAAETVVLVAGLAALLGLRHSLTGRSRRLAALGTFLIVTALLDTQSRDGMVMGALAATALALMAWRWRGAVDRWAVGACLVLAATTVLMLANVVGAAATAEEVARIEHTALQADELQSVRGGTGLSGRLPLWSASTAAIRARPVAGYGPGTNAIAIAPHLEGIYAVYRGLSPHSTWLRTGVEMGLPGLAALVAIVVAVAAAAVRRLRAGVDPTLAIFAASALAFTAGQFFETFLMGGVAFHSLYWALGLGLVAVLPREERSAYEPDEYWRRLHRRADLRGVGQSGLPAGINGWLYATVAQNVDPFLVRHGVRRRPPATAFEVGAGTGYWLPHWRSLGAARVDGCDLVPEAVDRLNAARDGGRFQVADISQPGAVDGATYDFVAVMNVLLHVTDAERFERGLRNTAALVAPGGWLFLAEPMLFHPRWERRARDGASSRARATERYFAPLTDAGMELVAVEPGTVLGSNPIEGRWWLGYAVFRAWWMLMAGTTRLAPWTSGLFGRVIHALDRPLLRTGAAPTTKFALFRRPSGFDQQPEQV